MAIQKITANDFASIIASGVNERDDTIDTRIGPLRDIFIDPVANILEQQNNRMVYLNKLSSLQYANDLVPDDVDAIMFNEGIVRYTGASSVVTLTFSRVQAPTADITIPVNFPIATLSDPASGNSVVFRTINTVTMYSASASQYYSADSGRYEIDVEAASVSTGLSTQVGANTITVFRRNFPQFEFVTNKQPTTSGKSIETNEEVVERYLLHVKGSQLSTPAGNKSFILDNFATVEDVYVVYGNDTNLTREQDDAGAIDLWIKGEVETTRSYVTTYPGTEILIELDRQPLNRVLSVSTSSGGGVVFVEGTDFEVVTGLGEYSYSNIGMDGIKFIAGGSHPDISDDVTISYVYNSLIDTLSSYFNQEEYHSMGVDKLYRWAQPKDLYIEASLKVRMGSPSYVSSAVRAAVLAYIANLNLGDDVEEFDIDRVVSSVVGVDNWVYSILDVSGGSSVGDVEIGPNEYARLLNSNLVINLV